jgi:anion-transporting  ArsA/GET3 family ATPase
MTAMLQRRLIVVTGKGGVGKTTVAGAIGLVAARHGLRTIVVDVTGSGGQVRRLFGAEEEPERGAEVPLEERLWSTSIDPDQALLEWLQKIGGQVPARLLMSTSSFQYFAAAAPGAKELMALVKVWRMIGAGAKKKPPYDLVVLDAPATGHALGLLRSPQTFGSIARVGPVASDAREVQELLGDPARTLYLAVASGTEMAITETIELRAELRAVLERDLEAVIVNGAMRSRFTREELERIASIGDGDLAAMLARRPQGSRHAVRHAAAHAARSLHTRARAQRAQVERLRRHGLRTVPVPFVFQEELDLEALERIAARIEAALAK